MKKLFSFISVFALAATLGISTVSAQKTSLTIERLWSITEPGGGAARQGFGMDGALYYHKQGAGVYKVTAADAAPELVISKEVTGIGSHSVAKDDAGNLVVFGSASFPSGATSELFIYVQKKGETTGAQVTCPALEGFNRTDFIAAAGDVFGTDGGHLYLINNDGKAAFDILIKDGAATATVLTGVTAAAQQNAFSCAHDGTFHYVAASQGIYSYDGTTATLVEGLTDLSTQCLGATHFTIAGKEVWAYHVGTNYTSEFKVLNKTDNAFVTDKEGTTNFILHANTGSGGGLRGVWLNAEKIDDNNYLLYAWHSHDGGVVYKVSAVVAATVALNCDAAMGTVEGAGDYAVGGNATIKAIPALGHSFVAWKNGEETVSTEAEYTFEVKEDVTLTAVFQKENDVKLTLAVNDAAAGSITLPEGIVMGENTVAYGTVVTLTAVPVEGATLNGWYNGETLYSTDYTINVPMTADMALTAKFVKVLTLAYELNGGVTNDYGWTSKGALMLEIQKDYNEAYNGSLAVVKEENGQYWFYIVDKWMTEYDAQGQAATVGGFFQAKTWSADQKCAKLFLDTKKDKYAFLVEMMDAFASTSLDPAGRGTIASMAITVQDAYFRADVSGFMLNSPATAAYPYTVNWAAAGLPESYTKVWKHAFANPTEIKGEVVLNTPYKEGYTFDGWYATADFTGEPIVSVSPESVIEGGKLYAKWIEYIPTIAEVREMEVGTEVKVKVIVNHVGGNTIYVEDASGLGMDIYMKNSGLQTGQEAVVVGTITNAKGWPRLEGKEVVSTKEGKLFDPVSINFLSQLVNDTTYEYYAKRVSISGLTVAKYAENGDVYFTDGTDTVQGYYMKLDQTTFPVGKVVNINGAVAAWYGENFQFTGDVASVALAPKGLVDTYAYPTRHEKYNLKNDWIYSTQHGNYKGNEPGAYDMVRGMVARDGKMYFADRGTASIIVVDAVTGEKLESIKVKGEHLFERQGEDGVWSSGCQYPYNDIKMDDAGNCLIGACLTSSKQNFYIYTVDLATGEATELINECLLDNPDFAAAGIDFRFDAFGVSGDVKGNACIMAADSKDGWRVYRWLITEGNVGKAEMITVKPKEDNALAHASAGFGTAPQIFPQDAKGEYFYADGSNTYPMLFDESGTVIEDFKFCPTGTRVWNNEGDTISFTGQPNGVCEFEVNGEYFLLFVAQYVTGEKSTRFALYKFDNDYRTFLEMEPLWYFPNSGMGSDQYQGRSAVPYVDVVGNTAHIYLYATNNGYAAYTFTVGDVTSAVENIEGVETIGAEKVFENGQVYIIKNGVKYNVLGAEIK